MPGEQPDTLLSTDLTFITNEAGKTLQDRFSALVRSHTRFFDCLVGYFFISGFHSLWPDLEGVDKIRILVGLHADRQAYDLIQRAKVQDGLAFESHAASQERAECALLSELEKAPDQQEIESGVLKFVEWIRSGKLEIKAHPGENLHAKVYIMTFAEGDRDMGRVITGSSNLSQAGLRDNLEFNVELKNSADYRFALQKFNDLWANAVNLSEPYRKAVADKSPFAHFTPYELYLKFLYEYFRTELSLPSELEDKYVPPGFMKLKYQEEAVLNARKVLDEYGGVFLSDVVGLGKTYMAALLAQQLPGRHLVIAPPHLLDRDNRGAWPNVFGDFQVRQTDFESIGKLDDILQRGVEKYENVFIDESHRFRTETTQSYEKLAQICRGKRVILVSATPLNNTPLDILSQVKLFQPGKASNIPNMRNLDSFFGGLMARLKGVDRKTDPETYFAIVQDNAKETREKVLKYLMVRRTRDEIEKYYGEDLKQQGFKFPDVKDPVPLFYQMNGRESAVFDETLRLLAHELEYARYKPLAYYEGDIEEREIQGQRNLAKFMKILMVKRLESSFFAFRLTLDRMAQSCARVIAEFKRGNVYISKKHTGKIFEHLEIGNQEAVERLLEADKAERLGADEFSDQFIADLEKDYRTFQTVQGMWAEVKRDPKWLAFRDVLRSDPHLNSGKVVIFTESRETAEYLAQRVRSQVEHKTLLFHGLSGEAVHKEAIANFDANAFKPSDDYRILVSTEVLSEGVNLHRSNLVVNYDIPWNPTRLNQRVGRVNRVDTRFDTIRTYNFFPSEEGNDAIGLREAAEAKIEAFIEMLGADSRLLTEGEEIKSHDLFAKLNSKKAVTGEDGEEESELAYLNEIKEVRHKDEALFERIKRLPKKARSTRTPPACPLQAASGGAVQAPALLTYFRKGKLDKFFLATAGPASPVELDFFAAAKTLKPEDPAEKRQTIPPDFYALLAANKQAFDAAVSEEADDPAAARLGASNEAYILKRLKAQDIRLCPQFTEDDEQCVADVKRLIADGSLPKLTARKVANALKKEDAPLKVLAILKRDIPPALFQPAHASAKHEGPREVILSSWICPAGQAEDAGSAKE